MASAPVELKVPIDELPIFWYFSFLNCSASLESPHPHHPFPQRWAPCAGLHWLPPVTCRILLQGVSSLTGYIPRSKSERAGIPSLNILRIIVLLKRFLKTLPCICWAVSSTQMLHTGLSPISPLVSPKGKSNLLLWVGCILSKGRTVVDKVESSDLIFWLI